MRFEQAFSEQNILRALVRLRVAAAKKRHDAHFLHNLSSAARSPGPEAIDAFFPPRRAWLRLPKTERAGRPPAQVAEMELLRTVQVLRRDPRHAGSEWDRRLAALVEEVRGGALGASGYRMAPARVVPLLKERKPGGASAYRPLTIYGLADRLVSGLCAMYLRRLFDPDFLPCSFAFRAKGPSGAVPQYHDAVAELLAYRARTPGDLWVAEQDIRGFYDCVHHDIARRALEQAAARAASRGDELDARAARIVEAYLDSYSFPTVARPQGQRWLEEHGRRGVIRWPEEDLRAFWPDPAKERIGVPQGGAISCLIANLILDRADRAVLDGAPAAGSLLYLRYVDDMICMSPEKTGCEQALSRYAAALAELRLPVHPPRAVSYGREFWTEAKSKSPYRWTAAEGGVPWVSFVGYQVRHDGVLRVRKASIQKELAKQIAVAGTVMRLVRLAARERRRRRIRLAKRQVLHRLRLRMSAMSVGRRTLSTPPGTPAVQCWCAGFRLLHDHPFVERQLSALDRGRERQIARVRRALERLPGAEAGSARSREGGSPGARGPSAAARPGYKGRRSRRRELAYFGFPFSYRGCFARRPK
jgi:hypothetical protein